MLQGGRTAHATFKLPLDLIRNDTAMCNISKGTGNARLLDQCSLIVWDECTMAHKNALEALNRTLMDIRNSNDLMGGVVLLLAGDFRQTLPIIPRGTRADIIKACLKSSVLWKNVKMLKLTTNMRVHLSKDTATKTFQKNLLKIGNGLFQTEPSTNLITRYSKKCMPICDKNEGGATLRWFFKIAYA